VPAAAGQPREGSRVHVVLHGRYRGTYALPGALRPETDRLLTALAPDYELALLSGDNGRQRECFAGLFGSPARVHFDQSPQGKLGFVRNLQRAGRTVLMVGDGLNDAGALRQADVGMAVVESVNAFSPASDVILGARRVTELDAILRFARQSLGVVRAAFIISLLYNVVGIAIAVTGRLSPIVCAILMPLSSVTVVAFACGVTSWLGRRLDSREARP
jgi:P-type Cu+ transporter